MEPVVQAGPVLIEAGVRVSVGALSHSVNPAEICSMVLSAGRQLQDAAETAKQCESICKDMMMMAASRLPVICELMRLGQLFPDDGRVKAHDLNADLHRCCKAAFETLQEAATDIYRFMQWPKVGRMMMAADIEKAINEKRTNLTNRFGDVSFYMQLATLISTRQTMEQVKDTAAMVKEVKDMAQELQRMCSPDKARVRALARAALTQREPDGQKLKVSREEVWAVAVSPCGELFATGSSDGTAAVWDAATGVRRHRLRGHSYGVTSVAWSPDRSKPMVATAAGTSFLSIYTIGEREMEKRGTKFAFLWCAKSGKCLHELQGHTYGVKSIAWSPVGGMVATGSFDGTAAVWDAATGNQIHAVPEFDDQVEAVAWSVNGAMVAMRSRGSIVVLWDVAVGDRVLALKGPEKESVMCMAWSPDGSKMVTGLSGGTAAVWDTAAGTRMHELQGHGNMIRSVAWSPDGSRVATGSNDRTAAVWDAGDGTRLRELCGHSSPVLSVAWNADGTMVATGACDATAAVWDAAKGTRIRELRGHSGVVREVVWMLDGAAVCTASADGTVRIYGGVSSLAPGMAV